MPRSVPRLVLALAPLLALSACQKPDVGARCTIQWGTGSEAAPRPDTVSADLFESGNSSCDDLICIVSPAAATSRYGACSGTACGYCSKPCVSNADCYNSDTGLVCRQMVLDPAFIAQLKTDPTDVQPPPAGDGIPDGQQILDRYLPDIRFSSYCAVP